MIIPQNVINQLANLSLPKQFKETQREIRQKDHYLIQSLVEELQDE